MEGYGETEITPATIYTDAELASSQPPGTCSCCWRPLADPANPQPWQVPVAPCGRDVHSGICRDCDHDLEHLSPARLGRW